MAKCWRRHWAGHEPDILSVRTAQHSTARSEAVTDRQVGSSAALLRNAPASTAHETQGRQQGLQLSLTVR